MPVFPLPERDPYIVTLDWSRRHVFPSRGEGQRADAVARWLEALLDDDAELQEVSATFADLLVTVERRK